MACSAAVAEVLESACAHTAQNSFPWEANSDSLTCVRTSYLPAEVQAPLHVMVHASAVPELMQHGTAEACTFP